MSRKKLEVSGKINSYKELEAAYRDCKDGKLRTRLLAVLQSWDKKPSLEVAKDIHMAATNVCK